MIKELFASACILFTIIFISSRILKNHEISTSSAISIKTRFGLLGGISTCILLIYSINITSQFTLDFRDICIIIVALFGGLFSSIITGIITVIFGFLYEGMSETSLLTALGVLFVCIGCGMISKIKLHINTKIMIMLLYSLLIQSIIMIIVINDRKIIITVLFSTWVTSIVVGIVALYGVHYLIESNKTLLCLKKESTHDYLTGLSNTRRFDTKYNEIMKEVIENNGKVALFLIDIDHFKNVNDTYGHVSGNEVLQQLGILLKNKCGQKYFVARIGGEEFAVILKNIDLQNTRNTALELLRAVAAFPFTISNGKKISIKISIGVALYPDTVEDIKDLKEVADNKLYEAKRTGRNKVCI